MLRHRPPKCKRSAGSPRADNKRRKTSTSPTTSAQLPEVSVANAPSLTLPKNLLSTGFSGPRSPFGLESTDAPSPPPPSSADSSSEDDNNITLPNGRKIPHLVLNIPCDGKAGMHPKELADQIDRAHAAAVCKQVEEVLKKWKENGKEKVTCTKYETEAVEDDDSTPTLSLRGGALSDEGYDTEEEGLVRLIERHVQLEDQSSSSDEDSSDDDDDESFNTKTMKEFKKELLEAVVSTSIGEIRRALAGVRDTQARANNDEELESLLKRRLGVDQSEPEEYTSEDNTSDKEEESQSDNDDDETFHIKELKRFKQDVEQAMLSSIKSQLNKEGRTRPYEVKEFELDFAKAMLLKELGPEPSEDESDDESYHTDDSDSEEDSDEDWNTRELNRFGNDVASAAVQQSVGEYRHALTVVRGLKDFRITEGNTFKEELEDKVRLRGGLGSPPAENDSDEENSQTDDSDTDEDFHTRETNRFKQEIFRAALEGTIREFRHMLKSVREAHAGAKTEEAFLSRLTDEEFISQLTRKLREDPKSDEEEKRNETMRAVAQQLRLDLVEDLTNERISLEVEKRNEARRELGRKLKQDLVEALANKRTSSKTEGIHGALCNIVQGLKQDPTSSKADKTSEEEDDSSDDEMEGGVSLKIYKRREKKPERKRNRSHSGSLAQRFRDAQEATPTPTRISRAGIDNLMAAFPEDLKDTLTITTPTPVEENKELIGTCENLIVQVFKRDHNVIIPEDITGHFKALEWNSIPELGFKYSVVVPQGFEDKESDAPVSKWKEDKLKGLQWLLSSGLAKIKLYHCGVCNHTKVENEVVTRIDWAKKPRTRSDTTAAAPPPSTGPPPSAPSEELMRIAEENDRLTRELNLKSVWSPSETSFDSPLLPRDAAFDYPRMQGGMLGSDSDDMVGADSDSDSDSDVSSTTTEASTAASSVSASASESTISTDGSDVTGYNEYQDDVAYAHLSKRNLADTIVNLKAIITEQSINIGELQSTIYEQDEELFEQAHLAKSLEKELAGMNEQLQAEAQHTKLFSKRLVQCEKLLTKLEQEVEVEKVGDAREEGEEEGSVAVRLREKESRIAFLEGMLRRGEAVNEQGWRYKKMMEQALDNVQNLQKKVREKEETIVKLERHIMLKNAKILGRRVAEALGQPVEEEEYHEGGDEEEEMPEIPPRAPSPPTSDDSGSSSFFSAASCQNRSIDNSPDNSPDNSVVNSEANNSNLSVMLNNLEYEIKVKENQIETLKKDIIQFQQHLGKLEAEVGFEKLWAAEAYDQLDAALQGNLGLLEKIEKLERSLRE